MPRNVLILIFSLSLSLVNCCFADMSAAVSAYKRGDYKNAYAGFVEAANKGDSGAIYNIGCMHKNGNGTDQDLSLALKYFRQAREMGFTEAEKEIIEIENYLKEEEESKIEEERKAKQLRVPANLLSTERWSSSVRKPAAIDYLATQISNFPISIDKITVTSSSNEWLRLRISTQKAYKNLDTEAFFQLVIKAAQVAKESDNFEIQISGIYDMVVTGIACAECADNLKSISSSLQSASDLADEGIQLCKNANEIKKLGFFYQAKSRIFRDINDENSENEFENCFKSLKNKNPEIFY